MKQTPRLILALVGSAMLLSISSCGGGGSSSGGGGTAPGVANPTATVVSGTVTAPGGAVAFFKQPSLNDFFVSEAYAALTGLVNVADNTTVQLARLNDATGTNFTVLSTTTTSGGRYSFNLTGLGLQPSNDLIVRIAGANGTQMRAFVVGTVADLSPVSEAAYQLAIQSLNGGALSNLTLQEVADINGAVGLISTLQNIGNTTSVDQAVGLVRSAVNSSAQVTGFIAAAAVAGQTTQGTGDIGGFFPFGQGNVWQYQVARTSTFQAPLSYQTTRTITGQEPAPIYGISSTVISDFNDEGENRIERSYHVKGVTGVTSYGNDDPNDDIERALSPYKTVHFPLGGGETTVIEDREGLNWGDDLDGDNRNELFRATLLQTVLGVEDITVPAGTFRNCLKIQRKAIFVVSFTTGGSVILLQSDTSWLASGLGTVRSVSLAQIEGSSASSTLTEELTFYSVDGQTGQAGGPPPPPPIPVRIEITPATATTLALDQTKVFQAAAYDQSNNPIPNLSFTWITSDQNVAQIVPINQGQLGSVTGQASGISTVTATLAGLTSNPLQVTVLDIRVVANGGNGIAYDKVNQRLYQSIPKLGRLTADGGIAAVDPLTGGNILGVQVQDDNPGKIVVSDDGQFLYVVMSDSNLVKRYRLPNLDLDLQFSIGRDQNFPQNDPNGIYLVQDIDVLPGSAQSVAIVRTVAGQQGGVAIYDNGIPRSITTPGFGSMQQSPSVIEFSQSNSTVYGFRGDVLFRMSVNSAGISVIESGSLGVPNMVSSSPKFDSGLLYVNSGQIINPVARTIVGSFIHPGLTAGSLVQPDSVLGRTFFLTGTGSGLSFLSFNQGTFQLLGSKDLSVFNLGGQGLTNVTDLVRWGTDGLIIQTPNLLLFFKSSLVQ